MSEFARYIGIPWEEGAEGPLAWDCMAFARHLQGRHFGVDMPRIMIPDYDDVRALVRLNREHQEHGNWIGVKSPQHGDLVLVRKPMHYGVWVDIDGGGVLHCVRGQGVVWTKDIAWSVSGFGRKEYLRHVSKTR